MIFSNVSILFKFLVGILLVQGATAVLVLAGLESGRVDLWLLFGALGLSIGMLAAFWFGSIASHFGRDAIARAREGFSRQREQIRVRAEREKTKLIKQSHQQIVKERSRTQNRASFKVWASFSAVLGLGALMLLTQFVTIGLLTLTTAGGALGGYLFRARQDNRARREGAPRLLAAGAKRTGSRLARRAQEMRSAISAGSAELPPG